MEWIHPKITKVVLWRTLHRWPENDTLEAQNLWRGSRIWGCKRERRGEESQGYLRTKKKLRHKGWHTLLLRETAANRWMSTSLSYAPSCLNPMSNGCVFFLLISLWVTFVVKFLFKLYGKIWLTVYNIYGSSIPCDHTFATLIDTSLSKKNLYSKKNFMARKKIWNFW